MDNIFASTLSITHGLPILPGNVCLNWEKVEKMDEGADYIVYLIYEWGRIQEPTKMLHYILFNMAIL